MSGDEVFFDANVLLDLLSGEVAKADSAEALVAAGGVISVQVLNEVASVASRKPPRPLDFAGKAIGATDADSSGTKSRDLRLAAVARLRPG